MTQESKHRAFIYKCRICGKMKKGAQGNFDLLEGQSILMDALRDGSTYRSRAMISRESFHLCEDGSLGISDLQGIIVEETK